MPAVPRLLFPQRSSSASRSLLQRLGVAAGILLFVAMLTWLGRDGYSDADGTPLSLLDSLYYATVTATTTGYGDIAPVSPGARAVTTFLVTPARILFLIVLVGTTLELLTERFRRSRLESRWRSRVKDHTIVAGFGTVGQSAVETLLAGGSTCAEDVLVIDVDADAVTRAREAGLVAIGADATHTVAWTQARVEMARAVIVTCNRDDTATLVTLTVRELNPEVPISVSVREAENARLLSQSGATTVVLSSEAAGRLVGRSTDAPQAVRVLEDLLAVGHGIDLVERPVRPHEVGGPPRNEGEVPVGLVRGSERIAFDDDDFQRTAPGDIVVCLVRRPRH
jgi:voltage-gated potassium channel